MTKTALVLRHVHFEDLGTFALPIERADYEIRYADVGDASFPPDHLPDQFQDPDLLVVLGGPVGVYEEEIYPFLSRERAFIAARLAARRPLLGVCLGAQLIAAAAGGRVFPSGIKEIGFKPVSLTGAGRESPLRHLAGTPVLHWHGDTYSLPAGAANLASSDAVEQQAFSIGSNVLALQFHPEVDCGHGFERWLVGHAAELAAARIDVAALRRNALTYGPALREAADRMITRWLSDLEGRSR